MVKDNDAARPSELLDNLDALRVVLCFDLLVVQKASVPRSLLSELKTSIVKFVPVLGPADVLDIDNMAIFNPVATMFACVTVGIDVAVRPRAVSRGKVVVEGTNRRVVARGHD